MRAIHVLRFLSGVFNFWLAFLQILLRWSSLVSVESILIPSNLSTTFFRLKVVIVNLGYHLLFSWRHTVTFAPIYFHVIITESLRNRWQLIIFQLHVLESLPLQYCKRCYFLINMLIWQRKKLHWYNLKYSDSCEFWNKN